MHRDWDTLIEAVRNWSECEVRIASASVHKRRSWPDNAAVVRPSTAQEVRDLYDWADLVMVPLKRNMHASGITVIAEAVSLGVPVICTDTGGLRAYFSEQEVKYVPPRNAQAIKKKIAELAASDDLRLELAVCAQRRILRDELTSQAYAISYRRLSESLLQPTS
jgi:glycosyltransferase involved in cell wall biosynthesis